MGGAGMGGAAGQAGASGGADQAGAGQGGGAGAGGAPEPPVPATKDELFAFLKAGSYKGFAGESKVHASTGPHSNVRTYLNAPLVASLQAGSSSHPQGSAAIKELYSGNQLIGWAVDVKTAADSQNGAGWYWYEVFSTTDGSSPIISNAGPNFCSNCHKNGGSDFVLTPFPLQ